MTDHKFAISLKGYIPAHGHIEQTFNAPFAVINAALYHALTIGMAQLGTLPGHDDTPGATRYHLRFPAGDIFLLYVLQRGENITTIQLHPVTQRGIEPTLHPDTDAQLRGLMRDCLFEATHAMRYTNPDFTLYPIEGITPPMPRYDDEGWPNVFEWHAAYARAWSDDDLARNQRVSRQTVSNARTKHGAQRRVLQDKPLKRKSEPKVSKKK